MATASANNAAHMPHMSTRLKRRSSDVRPCLRRSSDVRPSLPAMAGGALLDEAPQAYLPDANWDGEFHFYTILKVSIVSPVAEISRAFRTAAKTLHPDKDSGDTQKFQELNAAHTVLGNPITRDLYDDWCRRGRKAHLARATAAASSGSQAAAAKGKRLEQRQPRRSGKSSTSGSSNEPKNSNKENTKKLKEKTPKQKDAPKKDAPKKNAPEKDRRGWKKDAPEKDAPGKDEKEETKKEKLKKEKKANKEKIKRDKPRSHNETSAKKRMKTTLDEKTIQQKEKKKKSLEQKTHCLQLARNIKELQAQVELLSDGEVEYVFDKVAPYVDCVFKDFGMEIILEIDVLPEWLLKELLIHIALLTFGRE